MKDFFKVTEFELGQLSGGIGAFACMTFSYNVLLALIILFFGMSIIGIKEFMKYKGMLK